MQILLKLNPRFRICFLSILDGFISYKIYDKRDDFDFEIVIFPYLDGDVPRRAYYGVYIVTNLVRQSVWWRYWLQHTKYIIYYKTS